MTEPPYTVFPLSRRAMLSQAAVGFGSLALASLLADESRATNPPPSRRQSNRTLTPSRRSRRIFCRGPSG